MYDKPIPVQADLYWAFLNEVNQMSGKYQVDLCNLSAEAVKTLEKAGIEVKNDEKKPQQGFYITAKSKNFPIMAVDNNGALINDKIANGSKAVALVKPYQYNFKGKQGVGIGVSKIIVKEMIKYEPKGAGIEDLEDDIL